jgi:outer membrane protein assembly factor BamB
MEGLMKMKKSVCATILILGFLIAALPAQIKSQWRGPDRDGMYPNEKLVSKWPADGPALLWSVSNVEMGFSSPAVTADRVYVTGMKDGKGYLFAFDHTGKQIWKSEYGAEWAGDHAGSRSTPTIVNDKIYLESGKGQVVCLNEKDGGIVWKVDLIKTFGARNLRWGMTESLLIDGDRLFCTPGGSNVMIAVLDRNTGKTIKTVRGNGDNSGYCSPVLIKHGQRQLVLTLTQKSVVGIDAGTFDYLWSYPHETRWDVNPNTPKYHNGQVYTLSGYGTGGQLFNLAADGKSMTRVWADNTLDSQMGAAVLVDNYIYGSGHNNKGWHCVEWATGKVQYSARELGNKGNIIFSDGLLYLYSEKGDVGLVKPNPAKFEVISSFSITDGSGPHWAHMVIHKGRLYVRHGEVMKVYDISG